MLLYLKYFEIFFQNPYLYQNLVPQFSKKLYLEIQCQFEKSISKEWNSIMICFYKSSLNFYRKIVQLLCYIKINKLLIKEVRIILFKYQKLLIWHHLSNILKLNGIYCPLLGICRCSQIQWFPNCYKNVILNYKLDIRNFYA